MSGETEEDDWFEKALREDGESDASDANDTSDANDANDESEAAVDRDSTESTGSSGASDDAGASAESAEGDTSGASDGTDPKPFDGTAPDSDPFGADSVADTVDGVDAGAGGAGTAGDAAVGDDSDGPTGNDDPFGGGESGDEDPFGGEESGDGGSFGSGGGETEDPFGGGENGGGDRFDGSGVGAESDAADPGTSADGSASVGEGTDAETDSDDPFGGGGGAAEADDPFGGGGAAEADDPFGGGGGDGAAETDDPFGDDGTEDDPFGGGGGGAAEADDPFGGGGGGETDDPFGGAQGGGGGPGDDPFGEDFADAMGGGVGGGMGGGGGSGTEFDEEDFESEIERLDVGIEGLDDMILGGVPVRSLMTVIGSAGTGKTTFGLQFLEQAMSNGGSGVYITLEETEEAIVSTAEEKGWSFEEYVENDQLVVVAMDPIEMANSLDSIRGDISRLVNDFGADRLVLDSVSLLEMMYDHPAKRRSEVFDFARSLKRAGVTTMLTSEASADNSYQSRHGLVEYLVDAVFVLQYVRPNDFQETRLAVEIQKIRDANHSRETKPYDITDDGLSVYRQANIF